MTAAAKMTNGTPGLAQFLTECASGTIERMIACEKNFASVKFTNGETHARMIIAIVDEIKADDVILAMGADPAPQRFPGDCS